MTLLKKITDLRSALLRKKGKQEETLDTNGRTGLAFLQLVSLEQSQAIAAELRMNFIR